MRQLLHVLAASMTKVRRGRRLHTEPRHTALSLVLLGSLELVLLCSSTMQAQNQQTLDAAEALQALLDEAWAFALRESPLFATSVGEHRYNDRLPSVALEDIARRAEAERDFLARLRDIDRSQLGEQDRISYDMFERQLSESIEDFQFRGYLIPLTVDWGFHIEFARLPQQMPFATIRDYEDYISRLRAFPTYVDQHVALLRESIATGMTLPRVILEGYEETISAHVVNAATQSVFYAPFENFPKSIPSARHESLRASGRAAIVEAVLPGYQEFLDFMVGEYIPKARTTIGASELPNGSDYYAYLVRRFTTLEITPRAVHELGLAEVERIRAEMMKIIHEVGFQGDFAAFLEFLRTDPRFYAKTPEQLLKEAAYIAKRMDGKLPALFKKLPRLPYGVEPVPAELAPKFTAGRYIPAPEGSTRPGYYWVNTHALESRPLYALTALTLHEAVPGHHLQNELTRELEDLPEFRRFSYVNAFGEGWALYAEWLGLETGMYTDPYSDFGRLTYEMWRACRLVVDTGIHAFGWTRQQALEYLAGNTALSLHEVRTETDRYISWPGQALAYKMGELKIKELRRKAEQALGERFDLREFHDRVLASGTLPLTVLEEQIAAYIEERAQTRP